MLWEKVQAGGIFEISRCSNDPDFNPDFLWFLRAAVLGPTEGCESIPGLQWLLSGLWSLIQQQQQQW